MHTRRVAVRVLWLALATAAPIGLTAQASGATTLTVAERARYVGEYTLADGAGGVTPFRVFVTNEMLMGQLRSNTPTALLSLGADTFRPAASPEFTVRFTRTGSVATDVVVEGPGMRMSGSRVGAAVAATDPSTSGELFDALARSDSLLFDASFATCDYAAAAAFLAPDVEFYHDKTGLHVGDAVRDDFRRLTTNCPARNGVRRELVPGSLHVYPIKDFGAVQMGEHVFRERGSTTATAARFVHVWSNRSGRWVLTRVMSFDHLPTPAH